MECLISLIVLKSEWYIAKRVVKRVKIKSISFAIAGDVVAMHGMLQWYILIPVPYA